VGIIKEFCVRKRHVQIIALKDHLCSQFGKNELRKIKRPITRLLQKFLKIKIESENQSIRSEDVRVTLICETGQR
jgi:hypothetical protein